MNLKKWRRPEGLSNSKNPLKVSAAFHCFQHGYFVGVLEVGTDRNSDADSRDAHTEGLQQLRKIYSGGFAFGCGIRGDDDFFDPAAF